MRAGILKLLAIAVPLSVVAEDFCDRENTTHPDLLRGQEGSGASDPYWFEHVSDVEQSGHHRRLIYGVKNLNPTLELWAEWTRSDGIVELSFRRIVPGKCAQSYFETTKAVVEDSMAIIKYGQTKEPVKNNCSLYIETDQAGGSSTPTPSPPQPTAGPSKKKKEPLRSCIKADLKRRDGRTAELHLEFETSVSEKKFTYTVTNQGGEKQQFRIPMLAASWGRITNMAYKVAKKWETNGDNFVAEPTKQPSMYVVETAEAVEANDIPVTMEVVADNGERIATGPVTVYVPKIQLR